MTAPVIVIGAGPQGLAAAAHLLERGLEPLVLEAADRPAAAVAEWAHVRLFSDWAELVDAASARLLEATGWTRPPAGIPTGAEWISDYLDPLARALGDRVRFGERVTSVRRVADRLEVVTTSGARAARAVLDASGTWFQPAPAGADGTVAPGEREAAASGALHYRIPSLEEVDALEGRRIVVLGSGHSAATAIIRLAALVDRDPRTRITWALRRPTIGAAFGGGKGDALPARGALGDAAREAVESGRVRLVTGFRTVAVEPRGSGVDLVDETGQRLSGDRVIVLTGFRPDLTLFDGIDLALDPVLEAPVRLAPEIDPTIHSCGTVAATGIAELAHPDPGVVILGAKSYGRAPTFLALTGFEQVRSVVAHLAGDSAAAARNELVLPETGVCGGTSTADACCAPVALELRLGAAPISG